MLTSPSDYEYVDVSNAGAFIRGTPLPSRYTSATTNGVATCAYEDYLYLLEAYNERKHYDQDGHNAIEPANRIMPASAAEAITWDQSVGSIGGFINPNSTFPLGLTQQTIGQRTYQMVENIGMTLTAPKYSSYTIRSNTDRNLEGWCRRFYDYHMLTRLGKGLFLVSASGGLFTSFTGVATERYYYPHVEGQEDRYRDYTYTYDFQSGTYGWSYYRTSGKSSGGAASETIYAPNYALMSSLHIPHAKSATMLIGAQLHVNGTTTAQYCYPINMLVSNGNISFPNQTFVTSLTRSILQQNGYEYITSFVGRDAITGTEPSIQVDVGDGTLIIDFDFPADYKNWSWRPTNS